MFLHSSLKDIQLHFATPILQRPWPEAAHHNPTLNQLIMERMGASPSVSISNEGGWQSSDDLLRWDHPSISELSQWFLDCIVDIHDTYHDGQFRAMLRTASLSFVCTAWANVNRKGHWNNLHNHAGSHWSGVYYVQVPENCGEISFLDPRLSINMLATGHEFLDLFASDQHAITPQAGMTVIFPSWLHHLVKASHSDEPRISIAFNMRFDRLAAVNSR